MTSAVSGSFPVGIPRLNWKVNEQVPPAAGRVLGTGACVALIAVGAILRFALSAGSPQDERPL
jgi:hypothetical protein